MFKWVEADRSGLKCVEAFKWAEVFKWVLGEFIAPTFYPIALLSAFPDLLLLFYYAVSGTRQAARQGLRPQRGA